MINYRILTNIDESKEIWNKLSNEEEIFDLWEFRYQYYKFLNFPLYFITAYDAEKPVGLLPLMENNGILEFFGSSYMSYNPIFTEDRYNNLREELINKIKMPANLKWMKSSINHPRLTAVEKSTYFLNLKDYTNLEDYINKTWTGKSKNTLRRKIKKIELQNPKIIIDNKDDLDLLIELNKKRFGKSSVFNLPFRDDFFKEVVNKFNTKIISIKINNIIQAVALMLIHNNKIYLINTGANLEIDNLGVYLALQTIEYAIKSGAEIYDGLEGNYGWKENFGFKPRPQYYLDLS